MATLPKTESVPTAGTTVKEKPEQRNFFAEWAVTILMLLFGTTTILQAYVVPTGSMENTVLIGDHLFVDKLSFAPSGPISKHLLPYQEVQRGDIIVFRYPLDIRANYVKRAIGIPGDHIKLVNKELYVNGKKMNEPYKVTIPEQTSNYLNNFPQNPPDIPIYPRGRQMLEEHVQNGELVVPPGYYFAMGDNRDNSADSRFWGLVPRENIVGKPTMIFWSYDAPTAHLADGNLNPDHLLDLALNFFTKTRWNRTFMILRSYHLE
ncbi:MAG TPA: signal peptidase I [Bryobacteraceae bacterium]|jgi:signal peptidase I|nr:signal peptidase I [Bryobacteraceae bacterium]